MIVLSVAVVVLTLVAWSRMRPAVLTGPELPPVMRRSLYWWFVLTLVPVATAIAWVLLRGPLGLPRQGVFRFVPLMLGLMPLLVANPWYLWRTAWVRRALADSGGRLCTHCAYNLTGLPSAGRCPECGKHYDIAADAPLWQAMTRVTATAPPNPPEPRT